MEAAKAWGSPTDAVGALDRVQSWNLDDWQTVARRAGLGAAVSIELAREAVHLLANEAAASAVIQREPCTVPAPHDLRDCNGS